MIKLSEIINSLRVVIAIGVLVFIATHLSSCLEEPQVQLLQVDREYIDSIFSNSIDSLKIEIDSICLTRRHDLFDNLVDSIKHKRLQEIQSIFNEK